ncbi:hypothetical protein [Streptomyces xinghaiensis]|uniref:hypothetical protein n=1 Tax=Streptomyces xinghaiensis TaxID=1038928 RepID=UPI002E155AFD|nr:hypothetical protein OG463_00125 [Streptomyces xinghaiensis]
MSRARGRNRKYRVMVLGLAGAAVVAGGVAVTGAFAGQEGTAPDGQAAAQVISCPSTDGRLPEIPAQARAEVDRELAGLEQQIAEANSRLARSQGEGGPDFVRNAILGPLEDKRTAALNRIETAVGRVAEKPEGLEALAPCGLSAGAGEQGGDGGDQEAPPGGEENGAGAPEEGASGAGAASVDCPDVRSQLPDAIPAGAQSQIARELAGLEQQIAEANERLIRSQGEGGPDFVRNAILGPLEDKRGAVLDRIGQAIDREGGERPQGLEALGTCGLNEAP